MNQAPPKFRFEVFLLSASVYSMEHVANLLNFLYPTVYYVLACLVGLKKSNLGSSWVKIPLTEITGSCVCTCLVLLWFLQGPLCIVLDKFILQHRLTYKYKMTWNPKGVSHGSVYPKKYSAKVNKPRTIMSTEKELKYQ